jgi:hypothetical protein
MEYAPGITISQAVVSFEGNLELEHLNELESRLKTQRNKPVADVEKGLLITERSRRTGLPAVEIVFQKGKKEYIDQSTKCKTDALNVEKSNSDTLKNDKKDSLFNKFLNEKNIGKISPENNHDNLTQNDERSYIAVIHADGNNLGKTIQQIGKKLNKKNIQQSTNDIPKNNSEDFIKKGYRNFSLAIDQATKEAAQHAFNETFIDNNTQPEKQFTKKTVPFRPIVLSGDDLTVICEAKYAVKFTKTFLEKFEETSKYQIEKKLKDFNLEIKKLTACAGIAFIKNKFPFYYAAELAEDLCGEAKKEAKKLIKGNDSADVPSCLAFYKVESSFYSSYDEIIKRVLENQQTGIDFRYGPYFTDNVKDNEAVFAPEELPKISELIARAKLLNEKEAPSSQLRKWLYLAQQNINDADNLMRRTHQVLNLRKEESKSGIDYKVKLGIANSIYNSKKEENQNQKENQKEIKLKKTHIYDMVSLASLIKNKED